MGRSEKRAGRQGQTEDKNQVQQASAPLALYMCRACLGVYKQTDKGQATTAIGSQAWATVGKGGCRGGSKGFTALHSPCQMSRIQAASPPHLPFCKAEPLQGLPWQQAIYVYCCASAQAQTGLLRMSPRCGLCLQEVGQGARHEEKT